LNVVRDITLGSGWIVLPLDAATEGIHDRLSNFLAWEQDKHDDLPDVTGEARGEQTTFGVRAPLVEWQRRIVREVNPRWNLRRQLTTLAEHAERQQVGVLLALDELHSGDREELRRLSADMQHITKSESLPLAFLGAGLGEMDHTLLEDRKMTFFRRGTRFHMPPLESSDASKFLANTISDADGTITTGALKLLTEATGTLPHKMQLLGHCAWLAANAPLSTIDEPAAVAAIKEAGRLMDSHVSGPTWNALSTSEQEFLSVLAAQGGVSQLEDISPHLTTAATSRRSAVRLSHSGCVQLDKSGGCVLTDLIPAASVSAFAMYEDRLKNTRNAPHELGAATSPRARCNEYMPRAQARCILLRGHAGGHRSK